MPEAEAVQFFRREPQELVEQAAAETLVLIPVEPPGLERLTLEEVGAEMEPVLKAVTAAPAS